MSDIVADAKAWLETRPAVRFPSGRTHHEGCHADHVECLVDRLVAELERHRMTPEERACVEWSVNAAEACGYDSPLRNYLERTESTEAGRE